MFSSAVPIAGQVQHYAWGGQTFLPHLLRRTNTECQPWAEYWLGTHPAGPAIATTGDREQRLQSVLRASGFDDLQFLLKVLDVEQMLSVQVHPSRTQARAGFERENRAATPIDAPQRSYKDDNHKPELMVALSEFWLLHGVAATAEIEARLSEQSYLHPLLERLHTRGLEAAFATVLDGDDPLTRRAQQALLADLRHRPDGADKHRIEFWIARWLARHPDILQGVLTPYFLNLVQLQPGEGIYQPSGLLHAYLEGQNIELMANSDNVLRAGLTPKHIDVAELLKVGHLEPSDPGACRLRATGQGRLQHYPAPFDTFALHRLSTTRPASEHWECDQPGIILALQGQIVLQGAAETLTLRAGEAALLAPAAPLTLLCAEGSDAFIASNCTAPD